MTFLPVVPNLQSHWLIKKKNVHGEAMLAQEDDKMKNENFF